MADAFERYRVGERFARRDTGNEPRQRYRIDPNVEEGAAAGIALLPPSPNPFRDSAVLAFQIPEPARVTLDIFDAAGRRVARVLDAELPAGEHGGRWDGLDSSGHRCAAGVYLARLALDDGRDVVGKLVKVR